MSALTAQLTAELVVRGATLTDQIADLVTDWRLDLGTDRVTQLDLTVQDPGLLLWTSNLFERGADVAWRDLDLTITGREVTAGPATEQVRLMCRERGAQQLKRETGQHVWRDVAPHELAADVAEKVGLRSIVQPVTGRRTEVVRAHEPGQDPESTWDVLVRLGREEGMVLFVAAGTLYFGKPTWLVSRSEDRWKWGWRQPAAVELQDVPTCADSDDANSRTIEGRMLTLDALGHRPGDGAELAGVSGFSDRMIVSDVRIDAASTLADVSLVQPVDPEPRPPAASGPAATATTMTEVDAPSGSSVRSTPAIERFVKLCLKQAGDRYIWGAGRGPAGGDPGSFDCSGLIYWAARTVGLPSPGGTAFEQYNTCRRTNRLIPVSQGINTRGAMLFNGRGGPGLTGRASIQHVAISLGDGNTIEARGTRYGVGVFSARRGFDHAGLLAGG